MQTRVLGYGYGFCGWWHVGICTMCNGLMLDWGIGMITLGAGYVGDGTVMGTLDRGLTTLGAGWASWCTGVTTCTGVFNH